MEKILVGLLIFGVSLAATRAQDSGTQQQIDQLRGTIQDALEAQQLQAKRLDALEKEVNELRDKAGGPGANADDLQKLADQIQEIDKKRQADRELILKEIEKLGKAGGTVSGRKATPTVLTNAPPGGKESGYEYKVVAGDTFLIIAKKYSDEGIKVTAEQIQKANPGVDSKKLKLGQKIFIPAPAP